MESWMSVVVCITVGLYVCQTHAFPKAVENSDGVVVKRSSDDLDTTSSEESASNKGLMKIPLPEVTSAAVENKSETKKELSSEQEDKSVIDTSSSGAKLDVRFPEDSNQGISEKQEDDNVRSKKSTTMREINMQHPPHTTTVCIQVKTDHQPQVVCGTEVKDNKEDKPSPASARFAYQSEPIGYYYSRHAQESQPAHFPEPPFMRMSPQPIPIVPATASDRPHQQQITIPAGQQTPKKYVQENPSPMVPKASTPAAARGPTSLIYSMRRNDGEVNNQKPAEANYQPTSGQTQLPVRIPPQQSIPNSVVVHKQYYQVPFQQALGPNVISASPSPLRLNCALQPDGTTYVQPSVYGTSGYRSTSPEVLGYYPVGEHVVAVQNDPAPRLQSNPAPRMAERWEPINEQAYYIDTQARQSQPDQIVASPYGYSIGDQLMGATYVGADGQTYLIEENHARAAAEDQLARQQIWDQEQYLSAKGTSSSRSSIEELMYKNQEQERELKQSRQRLLQLQQQLKDIQQRATLDEEEKKETKKENPPAENTKESSQPSHETPEPQETKKTDPPKSSPKRQSKVN